MARNTVLTEDVERENGSSIELFEGLATEILDNVLALANQTLAELNIAICIPFKGKIWLKRHALPIAKFEYFQLPSYYIAMKSRLKKQPIPVSSDDFEHLQAAQIPRILFPFNAPEVKHVGAIAVYQDSLKEAQLTILWLLVETLELGLRSLQIHFLQNENKKLSYLANLDVLTQLPNRIALAQNFRQKLAFALKKNQVCGMLMLDLNDFKQINDKYGHVIGDKILYLVACRLKALIRQDDFCARLGGDEFIILTGHVGQAQVIKTAQRIAKTFTDKFCLANKSFSVGISIGISLFPNHGTEQDDLIAKTDQAMYRAKNSSTDFCLYEPGEG